MAPRGSFTLDAGQSSEPTPAGASNGDGAPGGIQYQWGEQQLNYEVVRSTPSVEDYLALRRAAGLGEKSVEAAERGLPNTLFGVHVVCDGQVVAMARLIGDAGTNYACVDAAVHPDHRGTGLQTRALGRLVVDEVARYFRENAPRGAYLMAITRTPKLGLQTGFQLLEAGEVGMYMWQPME